MKREDVLYPRILVVSNNAFSQMSNNGKTLASFFKSFPSENIAQLYFSPEIPSDVYYNNYFRITDAEIVKSFYSKERPGRSIARFEISSRQDLMEGNNVGIKKNNFFRLGREVLWLKKSWKTDSLKQWIEDFAPEIVFLCAGDSGFAYDITNYIQRKFNSKLVVYITDDYILPRSTYSPLWWIRRSYIYNKMKKIVRKSNLFITISEEMKQTYKDMFGVDSILAMNMTESMYDAKEVKNNKEHIIFLYAGGLHFKRHETLRVLAESILNYNLNTTGKHAILKIYSGNEPTEEIKEYLSIEGASKYCGSLNPQDLKKELNQCDIPVHVESFDKRCIESTRLSISTKIPEYLSLGKPILAIGPSEVASMKYISDCSFCITKPENIYSDFKIILTDDELKEKLSNKALIKYKKYHDFDILEETFKDNILRIFF